jgi:urease subunit alpha
MPSDIDRDTYGALYGPTAGDRIRLGDTDLIVEVERDESSYGDEVLAGCGKTMQAGMLIQGRQRSDSALDVVISNVVIIDPVLGVFKGNIGIAAGRIVGVGRAGNPDVMDNVDLTIGPHTSLLPGEGLIATPGGVDSHVHLSSAPLLPVLLGSGITTIVGMGAGGTRWPGSPSTWRCWPAGHTIRRPWRQRSPPVRPGSKSMRTSGGHRRSSTAR